MRENSTITWQSKSRLLHSRLHGYLWIINQRVANVLVVDLVFFRDRKSLNDRRARYLSHLAELVVVIVLRRAEIWLACGQPRLYFPVEESVSDTETFSLGGKVFNVTLFGLQRWAEQAITLVIRLQTKEMLTKAMV